MEQLHNFIYRGIPQRHLKAFYELTGSTKYDIMAREVRLFYDAFKEESIDAIDEGRFSFDNVELSNEKRTTLLALLQTEDVFQTETENQREPSEAQKRTEEFMEKGYSPLKKNASE